MIWGQGELAPLPLGEDGQATARLARLVRLFCFSNDMALLMQVGRPEALEANVSASLAACVACSAATSTEFTTEGDVPPQSAARLTIIQSM